MVAGIEGIGKGWTSPRMGSRLTIDLSARMLSAWVSTEPEWLDVRLDTGVTTVGSRGEGKEKLTEVGESWVTKP